jgi:hypothetical protein
MDAVRVTFTTTVGTAIAGVLVDDITSQLGSMYDLHYQSSYLYRNTTGTWIEKPTATDNSDILNLSFETINIMVELTAMLGMREVKGMNEDFDRLSKSVGWPHPIGEPTGLIGNYLKKYPSERITNTNILHDFSV